jgi:hypothetical protein
VWNLIAPKYQYQDEGLAEDLARIMTGFITESLALCGTDMPSRELKVYLGNAIGKEYAVTAAAAMERMDSQLTFAVNGSWLHIKVEKEQ